MTSALTRDFSYLPGPHGRIASLGINIKPDNKARILMSHGYSGSAGMVEHAKLFLEMAEQLAAIGFGSVLYDFTGNGLSDGVFSEMTPNKRIDEAVFMIDHASSTFTGPIFQLGLSMGGAISIHATARREDRLSGLVTWSCVPSFEAGVPSGHWYPEKSDLAQVESPGPDFYTDRPDHSIADVYCALTLPKLQIQGDQDFAHFAEEFAVFFEKAQEPKKHIILKGGDHVFTDRAIRTTVIGETTDWLINLLSR